jgi:NAD(P)-dependent dehydrogenase (short-subunit alcohol dehydrogenase family)
MNVVITGTSSGIGRSLAARLLRAGHQVWGLARRPYDAPPAPGHAATPAGFSSSVCDVSQYDALAGCAQTIGQAWNRVDGLVCCAGVQGPIGNAMTLDPEAWQRSVTVNLTGTYLTIRAFYPLLCQASRRAKVVCFSGGGATGPRVNFTPYASAKAGVVRLVENLAHEWATLPMDINAIAPGAVNTRMTEEVLELGPDIVGQKEFTTATAQWKNGGTPAEVYGGCVDYLLSEKSDHLTGRLISAKWDDWAALDPGTVQGTERFTLRRITGDAS